MVWSARRGRSVLVGVLVLGAAAACTTTATMSRAAVESSVDPDPTSSPVADPRLSLAPAQNATNVAPGDPVTVTIANGTLDSVSLSGPDKKLISGQFDADLTGWTSSEVLAYDKVYTLKVAGSGTNDNKVEQTQTFKTAKARNFTLPTIRANDGSLLDQGTFGVGQPIIARFDEPIRDRAAAEKTLWVTTDPPGIVGSWYWMSASEVHWRPREYWPAGTKVTVEARVAGKNLGNAMFGQANRSATFSIGPKRIAVADSATHRMKVYVDDVQVTQISGLDVTAGIPISMGKGGTQRTPTGGVVDFTTNSGPHVITLKYEQYRMTSASFGLTDPKASNYYDVVIAKSMRISGDGEFVHLRDWEVNEMGVKNTSHGCVNVGVPFINWLYDTFGAGDVVDVTGTSRKLDVHNGLGDWVLSWEDWQKGSALR